MEFSIIIPVYNSERYLDRCIQSIIQQTYSNWELILVDDGSVDGSWSIIKKYQERDSRIKGYRQTNSGPGLARNVGIDKATGDYVVFVDSDDYIDKDYLELINTLSEENELVFIDVMQVDFKGNHLKDEKMSYYMHLEKESILKAMMTGKIPWGGVRKTVSLKLLNTYHIRYSDLKIGEEALFSFQSLYNAKKVGFLCEKPVYMYEVHEGSQSTLKMDDPWGGTYRTIRDYLVKSGLYSQYAATLNALNVSSTIVAIDRITQNYRGKERRIKIKSRFALYLKRLDKKYGIDAASLTYKAKIFLPFLRLHLVYPIVLCSALRVFIKNITQRKKNKCLEEK